LYCGVKPHSLAVLTISRTLPLYFEQLDRLALDVVDGDVVQGGHGRLAGVRDPRIIAECAL
jgi:hypothetical protein